MLHLDYIYLYSIHLYRSYTISFLQKVAQRVTHGNTFCLTKCSVHYIRNKDYTECYCFRLNKFWQKSFFGINIQWEVSYKEPFNISSSKVFPGRQIGRPYSFTFNPGKERMIQCRCSFLNIMIYLYMSYVIPYWQYSSDFVNVLYVLVSNILVVTLHSTMKCNSHAIGARRLKSVLTLK